MACADAYLQLHKEFVNAEHPRPSGHYFHVRSLPLRRCLCMWPLLRLAARACALLWLSPQLLCSRFLAHISFPIDRCFRSG